MSLRHALLGSLADRPRTGYALTRHFEQSLAHAWPAGHSQIYPELARLVEAGLIRVCATGPRGPKEYELTDAGLAELRRWLREEPVERRVRSDATLRVFFLWLLEPREAAGYLRRERDYWEERLAEYEQIREREAVRSRKQQAFRIALEAGIAIARARIEWARWAEREVARRR